jgi:hypothetical protein
MACFASGFAASAPASAAKTPAPAAAEAKAVGSYGKVPLSFEPNQGQTDPSVQFLSRGTGYSLFLTPGEVVLSLEQQAASTKSPNARREPELGPVDTLRMKLLGANADAAVTGVAPQAGVVNYLIGNDPKKWHTGIKTFGKVNYAQIYPGVDLVFYGNQRQLEYDFVVAPGADASRIAWQIVGAKPEVDAAGDLQLHAANGPASFKKPVIYQMDGDRRIPVEGAFNVAGNQIRFKLGSYDHAKPLVIDPILSYASYLAGSTTDNIGMNTGLYPSGINNITQAAAVDGNGSLYVTGYTYSPDFPTTSGVLQPTSPARTAVRYPWAFVTKVSPDGSSLDYSTYLGGSVWDYSAAIAVDSNGDAYVTGYTASPDFPITAGAYDSYCGSSWNTPATGVVEISGCPGLQSAFVTELNPQGTGLVYSTFLDGYGNTEGVAIAVDSAGRAYVMGNAGVTCASYQPAFACFPTTATALIQGSQPGGYSPSYTYVSVFDPTGSTLLFSTLLGDLNGVGPNAVDGSGPTYATGITVDAAGNFYAIANTLGIALPTTSGVVQPTPNGINAAYRVSVGPRGYVAKFTPVTTPGGPTLAWGTYLGGGQALADSTSGIAVDANGNVYVAGFTTSYDFPVTPNSYQPTCGLGVGYACSSAYLVKLNPSASEIVWGTFIGGLNSTVNPGYQGPVNEVGPVQLDGQGNVYITGQSSLGFPLVNAVEPATGGNAQAFVSEFDPTGSQLLFSSLIGSGGSADSEQYSAGMVVDAAGDIYLAGNTFIGLITTPGSFQPNDGSPNYYHGFVAKIAKYAPSATALMVSPSTANFGQSVTLTATVTGTGIASTPTGTVTFYNGTTDLGAGTLNGSGVATYTTTTLAPNTYSLTASYGGDTNFGTSTSPAQPLTVNAIGTSTALSITPGATFAGQTVTFTAQITPASGTSIPTGTVTFLNGGNTLGTAPVNAAGVATFTTSTLTAANYSVTAMYGGSADFSTSTSSPMGLTINALVNTGTMLSASSNSVVSGTSVTFTAKVAPASGNVIPTGTITFLDGATSIGVGTLDSTGTATLVTSALPLGSNSITASYGGDSGDNSSVSSPVSVAVNSPAVNTATVLGASASSVASGTSVTFTATVSKVSGTGAPTGAVSFYDGATLLGAGTLNGAGKATLTTTTLPLGPNSVTASYGGDSGDNGSVSNAVSVTVTSPVAGTATTLSASATSVVSGTPITFTATVTPASGPVPTGTVTFSDGATVIGSGTLTASGQAVFTTSSLAVGTHSITAAYGGSTTDTGSTSAALSVMVTSTTGKPDFKITVTRDGGRHDHEITLIVTVTPINGFSAPVSLSCTDLPRHVVCTFRPPVVTPHGGPATSTLIITGDDREVGAIEKELTSSEKTGRAIPECHNDRIAVTVTATSGSLTHSATYEFDNR